MSTTRPGGGPMRFPLRSPVSLLAVAFVVAVVRMAPSRPLGFMPRGDEAASLAALPSIGKLGSVGPDAVARDIISASTPIPTPAPEFISYVPADGATANELGRIPILMYHAFVWDEAYTDEWTITYDQFREQLDWLRDNDFVMVGLNGILDRNIDIPAGKRPVILTFDDASSGQFRLRQAKNGGYEVDPHTAVGILEEYRRDYPEFGGPAFLAVLPYNCFTHEDDPSSCEERLTWLVEHDYEVGNHTMGHQNLADVPIERFKEEIIGPIAWFAERIEGRNNLSDVLVLPFGEHPHSGDQERLLFDGFWHYGEQFVPRLVIEVSGGPTRSPYHLEWTTSQTRHNTDPGTFWHWADLIASGEVEVYVSDGDPDTVTVPEGWMPALDQELIQQDDARIVVLMSDASA